MFATIVLCALAAAPGGKSSQPKSPLDVKADSVDKRVEAAIKRLSLDEPFFRARACADLEKLGHLAASALPKLDRMAKEDVDLKVRSAAEEVAKAIRIAVERERLVVELTVRPPPAQALPKKSVGGDSRRFLVLIDATTSMGGLFEIAVERALYTAVRNGTGVSYRFAWFSDGNHGFLNDSFSEVTNDFVKQVDQAKKKVRVIGTGDVIRPLSRVLDVIEPVDAVIVYTDSSVDWDSVENFLSRRKRPAVSVMLLGTDDRPELGALPVLCAKTGGSFIYHDARKQAVVPTGALGMTLGDLAPESGRLLGIPAGIVVSEVLDCSRSQLAGFREQDIIVRIGNQAADKLDNRIARLIAMREAKPGTSIELLREGKRVVVRVPLPMPAPVEFKPVPELVAAQLKLSEGWLMPDPIQGSRLHRLGAQRDDILVEVDGRGAGDLRLLFMAMGRPEAMSLVVYRKGTRTVLTETLTDEIKATLPEK